MSCDCRRPGVTHPAGSPGCIETPMTADDPRPAGEVCRCGHDETDHGFDYMPDRRSACIQCRCPCYGPAASGGATDPERDEYVGHVGSCRIFYAEHRCTCGRPGAPGGATDGEREEPFAVCPEEGASTCRAAAGQCCMETHSAPVVSQADDGLREEVARWIFCQRVPERYWGTGTLYAEAEARSDADKLLALPAVQRLIADAAKVQAVRELRPVYTRSGERAVPYKNLHRALGDDQ